MRTLLNTLYVTNTGAYLSADGENVVVNIDGQVKGKLPLLNFEGIVTFGYAGISPGLMEKCLHKNISVAFLSKSGNYKGRIIGVQNGNVMLRRTQYRFADSVKESLKITKNILLGKIYNTRWVIERYLRDHALRIDIEKFKSVSSKMYEGMKKMDQIQNKDSLRGIEGELATQYFSLLDDMILGDKDCFKFTQRTKHPPLNRVNALLSFAYTLLSQECATACEIAGLDSYVGFLHTDRAGRRSLALDLMEELRSVYADRFVLGLINRRQLKASDFIVKEDGAVVLTDDARKLFLQQWQERKQKKLVHPYLKEKIEWGLVPYVQAMLLARYIRGDLDQYPPFLWK